MVNVPVVLDGQSRHWQGESKPSLLLSGVASSPPHSEGVWWGVQLHAFPTLPIHTTLVPGKAWTTYEWVSGVWLVSRRKKRGMTRGGAVDERRRRAGGGRE